MHLMQHIEQWFLENPEWFGLPPIKRPTPAPAPTIVSKPKPEVVPAGTAPAK